MLKPYSEFVRLIVRFRVAILALSVVLPCLATTVSAQDRKLQNPTSFTSVPKNLLLQIVRAEDERRWDNDVRNLLSARSAVVRSRAALAAGRIGNENALADLIRLLQRDDEQEVRAMAAFAIGEIESEAGADALLSALTGARWPLIRARVLEALGKIAAALPKEQESRRIEIGNAILQALKGEHMRRAAPDRLVVLLGLTATLRAKPPNAGPVVAEFLTYNDPRIRADAGNTLARLRLKDGNTQLRKLLVTDPDAVVRANAARVLGTTEEIPAFDMLLDRALNDRDSRVRVSAIRALASLKDGRATVRLLERGNALLSLANLAKRVSGSRPAPAYLAESNELLEIATTLGRLRQNSDDERTVNWLRRLRPITGSGAPEVEIAIARIYPAAYLRPFGAGEMANRKAQETLLVDWRAAASIAQGLGEIAAVPDSTKDNKQLRDHAEDMLRAMLSYRDSGIIINTLVAVHSEYAIPDILRAFAAFKPKDLSKVLGKHLQESDIVIRATAAELLGELPSDDTHTTALINALPVALRDKELNDAALAILDALGKQKNAKANEAIKTALDSSDHLIRRRAVALLKANGAGEFSSRIGTVQTGNTPADYERALSRMGKRVDAIVKTSKGSFTIQLLPDEAPLNVDNFIKLANRGYFRGITIHRVVPNFVMQDGDPRGDGNGGPGYQIRCEINEESYERGAVGMALSGKDTGGSQWFVTHSPQPHLDGGYTVFGKVIAGMAVVDDIARGDVVTSVEIREDARRAGRRDR
ncbi:MAG: peptidylprolyl isomerase [Acidobacteriota bacterium]|nr:peptidylprolyl isomerase [Acidobacteriota bacterium]